MKLNTKIFLLIIVILNSSSLSYSTKLSKNKRDKLESIKSAAASYLKYFQILNQNMYPPKSYGKELAEFHFDIAQKTLIDFVKKNENSNSNFIKVIKKMLTDYKLKLKKAPKLKYQDLQMHSRF